MDKYEYRIRAEEINALIERKEYVEAVKIADTIDWRRVRSVVMLCKVSELYKMNRRYEDSKEVLLLAYDLQPNSRKIVYSLCELSIKLEETVQAVEYYKEFIHIAPRDTGRFILQYRLYEAQDVSLEERIAVLEEYKKRDYREKWAYELAYLYHRIGLATRCVEECDELVLWFGEGRYVIKALELKMLHAPLTPVQQEKYNARFAPVEEVTNEVENPVQEEADQEPSLPIEIKAVEPTRAKTEEIPARKVNEQTEIPYDVMTGYVQEETPEEIISEGSVPEESVSEEISQEEVVPEEMASEETATEESPEDEDMKIVNPAEDLDIHVKTIDVDDAYNTINLQEELAKNLAEILAQEDMEAVDATKALPVDSIFQAATIAASLEKEEEVLPESVATVEEVTEVSAPEEEEVLAEAGTEKEDEIEAEVEAEAQEEAEVGVSEVEASEPEQIEEISEETESEEAVEETEAEVPVEATEEAVPEEAIPEEAVPEKAVPEEAVPEEAVPEEAVPEEAIPEEAVPEEAIPEEAVPEEAVPEEAVPEEAVPEKAVAEIASEEVKEEVKEDSVEEIAEVKAEEPIEELETEELEEIEEIEEIDSIEEPIHESVEKPAEIEPIFFGKNEPLPEALIQAVQSVAMEAAKEAAKQAAHATVEAMKEIKPEIPVSDKEELLSEENKEEKPEEIVTLEEKKPEPQVEKQITGQLSFTDIMAEWEETKKANEERHLQEMKQRVLEQTGPLFSEFDAATGANSQSGLEILSPTLDVFSYTDGLATEVENALEEETFVTYETPSEEEAPVMEETPVEETIFVTEEVSAEEEVSVTYEAPSEEEAPVMEETPVEETIFVTEEVPAEEEVSVIEEFTAEKVTETVGKESENKSNSFNTEEINGLEEKLMVALDNQHYETANIPAPIPVEKEEMELRVLTKEEKEFFGSIAQTKEMQEKVACALDSISLIPNTGNVIVTGEKGTGALETAQNVAAYLSRTRSNFTGNSMTYTDKEITEEKIASIISEVENGALIVNNAGDISASICSKLMKAGSELEGKGIVFIFVDTKSDIDRLTRAYQKLTEYFDVRIDITTLDNNGLVNFGKEYAKEKEYSIDDMGVLALYNRIEKRQTNEHAVTVDEVKEIVNEAIIKAEKKNLTHFMDIVFAKRYNKDDMVVLREKDFMNE